MGFNVAYFEFFEVVNLLKMWILGWILLLLKDLNNVTQVATQKQLGLEKVALSRSTTKADLLGC